MRRRGWPSRSSASAPTPTSPSSSTIARARQALGADGVHLGGDGDPRAARRCLGPRRRSASPVTIAATWRWKRARRAPITSRSALSIPRSPRRSGTGPSRAYCPGGRHCSNSQRRDRRRHAGQRPPVGRCRRRLPGGVQRCLGSAGGTGQGRRRLRRGACGARLATGTMRARNEFLLIQVKTCSHSKPPPSSWSRP